MKEKMNAELRVSCKRKMPPGSLLLQSYRSEAVASNEIQQTSERFRKRQIAFCRKPVQSSTSLMPATISFA